MFRYVLLKWNPESAPAREAAQRLQNRIRSALPQWTQPWRSTGLSIHVSEMPPYRVQIREVPDGAVGILGLLFRKPSSDSTLDTVSKPAMVGEPSLVEGPVAGGPVWLSSEAAAEVFATRGQALIDKYWGCYVALLHNSQSRNACVIRGPMSDLACLHTQHDGVDLFFSRVEDAVTLGCQFLVNWDYLLGHAVYLDVRGRETGLTRLTCLEVGEAYELEGHTLQIRELWNPGRVAQSAQVIEDFDAAAAALRGTTQACVDAWSSCHSVAVLRLSGGLDSSIVAACLHQSRHKPEITYTNSFSPTSLADERKYARLVAERTGARLIERERDPRIDLSAMRGVAKTPDPMRDYSGFENHLNDMALARWVRPRSMKAVMAIRFLTTMPTAGR
jgi:asparagine synthase (glutamine-hydrolysing)